MTIWYSTYQLFPRGTINSKSKAKFRKGALLRVRYSEGQVGYADICPFSEMGDAPLELELRALSQGKPKKIGARALHFAEMDAFAREQKRSLYSLSNKIKNHYLISDLGRFDGSKLKNIEAEGYSEIKIKMGRDLITETALLEKMVQSLSTQFKLRLDFNASLSRDRFTQWFESQQSWLRPWIQFIEDPFVYTAKDWLEVSEKWNLVFALDQAADPLKQGAEGAQVIVIKPAIQDEKKIIAAFQPQGKKFVFTNYMDFPVGQMFALVSAQRACPQIQDQLLTCGLQNHDIYDGFTFQSAIRTDGPYILPPDGHGIGFDDLLSNLTWTELI